MHVFTHLKKESQGKTGLGLYPDGMVETDGHVGQLLKLLDDLGVADNTIVVYTTDNGAEAFTWPDGGTTPFKGEKATNWEGAFRVPCLIRWPGVIKPGTIVNDICAHEDFIPTFAAAAGEPDLVAKVMKGSELERQDLQGPPRWKQPHALPQGRGERIAARGVPLLERRRRPDGDPLSATGRSPSWSSTPRLAPKRQSGVWQGQFTKLRMPESVQPAGRSVRARTGEHLLRRLVAHRAFAFVPAQAIVAKCLESFKEFPPRAKAASFTVSDAMDKIMAAANQN